MPVEVALIVEAHFAGRRERVRYSEHSSVDGETTGGLTPYIVIAVIDPQTPPKRPAGNSRFLVFCPRIFSERPFELSVGDSDLTIGELQGSASIFTGCPPPKTLPLRVPFSISFMSVQR